MKVDGIHPKHGIGSRIRGGTGGDPGRHGKGGRGGFGGPGGNSYSWTEYRTVTKYDSNGRSYTSSESVMRFNPGGMMGPWGSRGWTPTNPLYGGNNGKDGTFVIKIKHACTNLESSFSARYNLEFESIVTEQVSSMVAPKTYEFGETVFVTKIKVKNTGRMPTPSQRVLFKFGEVEGVNYDLSSHIFLVCLRIERLMLTRAS